MRKKGVYLVLAVLLIWALAAAPAWAVTDYEFLRAQKWKTPQTEPVELGTLRIETGPLLPETHRALFSLPRDFELRLPADGFVPALDNADLKLELQPVGKREFTGTLTPGAAVSEAVFMIPILSTIPSGHSGDIELGIKAGQGQLPDGLLVAGAAVPGKLAVEVTAVGQFKDGKAAVEMELRENMADLLWKGTPVKLTLSPGFAWADACGTLTEGAGFRAAVETDGPVLEVRPERQSSERATYQVKATLRVADAALAEAGDVLVTVDGIRDTTADRLLVAHYEAPDPEPKPEPEPAPEPDVARTVQFTIGTGKYTVNGGPAEMDAVPYVKNGRTFLPLRYVGLSLGVDPEDIEWDGRIATLTKGDTVVKAAAGTKSIDVNGVARVLDAAPEMAPPGRIMLPYRAVAEAFGAQVEWDAATKTVQMTL